MMQGPLDRPIWHALTTRQAAFAEGSGRARRFAADVAPFAAARDDGEESLRDLAALVPEGAKALLLQAGEAPLPPGLVAETTAEGVQMIARAIQPLEPDPPVERLTDADVPEMIALARLTKPGPFEARTNRLGAFWGIRQHGRLVAMAGERMKLDGFTEVSGVCTHPDARGRGYAGLLSRIVATQIQRRGETPILHAYAANTPALTLYKALGFVLRAEMTVKFIARA